MDKLRLEHPKADISDSWKSEVVKVGVPRKSKHIIPDMTGMPFKDIGMFKTNVSEDGHKGGYNIKLFCNWVFHNDKWISPQIMMFITEPELLLTDTKA